MKLFKHVGAPLPLAAAIFLSACGGHMAGPSSAYETSNRPAVFAASTVGMSVKIVPGNAFSEASTVKIFDNLAQLPSGKYWGGEQIVIVGGGGSSTYPDNQMAAAFTPSADHTATTVEVAVVSPALQGYGDSGFTLNINRDSNGVPGTPLLTAQIPSLPPGFPLCCSLITGRVPNGLALSGGKQYWIVVSGQSGGSMDAAAWDENATDQLHPLVDAVYCAFAAKCPNGAGWYPFESNLGFGSGLAFAVLGDR